MRLILTILGTLFFVFIFLLSVYMWGSGQNYKPYEHEYWNNTENSVVAFEYIQETSGFNNQSSSNSKQQLSDSSSETNRKNLANKQNSVQKVVLLNAKPVNPNELIYLEVRISKDQKVFAMSPAKEREFFKILEAQKQSSKISHKISDYDYETILKTLAGSFSEQPQALQPQTPAQLDSNPQSQSSNQKFPPSQVNLAPLLSEMYTLLPDSKFLLNVMDNVYDADTLVVDSIKNLNPDKRTAVYSPTDIIIKTIKKIKPEWLYGTSQADLLRVKVFDSLFILPAVNLASDFFVSPLKLMNQQALNPKIIEEMHKRFKRVFIGPIYQNDLQQLEAAKGYKPEFIILKSYE